MKQLFFQEKDLSKISPNLFWLKPADFVAGFKKLKPDAHKANFGHLLILAGSQAMLGAGYLASLAALRGGAGLVTYGLPEGAFEKFDTNYPEIMPKLLCSSLKGAWTKQCFEEALQLEQGKQALLIGPAMGRDEKIYKAILESIPKWKLPLVLDAEGINALRMNSEVLKSRTAPAILTPHHKEMGRLIGWSAEKVKQDPLGALALSGKLNAIVVLKGYRTLISLPSGEIYVNPTGNLALATAGSGDVLAGLIASFVAQGVSAEKAALAGVYIHGLAGDYLQKELGSRGLIASDLLKKIPIIREQLFLNSAQAKSQQRS